METTTATTEASAVKDTRKCTAKKFGKDMYIYRGWLIKKWNNNYLCDDEIRGVQWNTYKTLADCHSGSSMDIVSTLKEAKRSIDISLNTQTSRP